MKMESQIRMIAMEQIIPNRFQPRLQFDQAELTKLADSIIEHGIIQPLVLRRVGEKFEIIAGERRYKASQLAGLTAVPAIITDLDDNESAEVAIIENTHRKDLSAIEEAKSYKKLLDRRYLTQDQLAKRLGTSQSTIANKIRLLSLDDNVQRALMDEKISERHARSLLRVTDKKRQVDLLNSVVNERWNVRKLDDEIDKILQEYRSNSNSFTGGINAHSRIDVNVDDIMDRAVDIHIDDTYEPVNQYVYQGKQPTIEPGKKGGFFNSLENEAVNMDPNGSLFTQQSIIDDDLEELEDFEEVKTINEATNVVSSPLPEQQVQPVQPVPSNEYDPVAYYSTKEQDYTTLEEVQKGIKKILANAKNHDVPLDFEEFNFTNLWQIVVKVKPVEKTKEEK